MSGTALLEAWSWPSAACKSRPIRLHGAPPMSRPTQHKNHDERSYMPNAYGLAFEFFRASPISSELYWYFNPGQRLEITTVWRWCNGGTYSCKLQYHEMGWGGQSMCCMGQFEKGMLLLTYPILIVYGLLTQNRILSYGIKTATVSYISMAKPSHGEGLLSRCHYQPFWKPTVTHC